MAKHKSIPKKIRKEVYEKCHHHCAYCGCELMYEEMQVDHLNPVYLHNDVHHDMTEEEMYDVSNLMPSCRQCNFYKRTLSFEDFSTRLQTVMMDNLRKQFTYKLALKYKLITENDDSIQFYFEKLNESRNQSHNKYTALDVSKYILWYEHEFHKFISLPKLQKLLYFIQVMFVAHFGDKCFSDAIIATDYGPIVESVNKKYWTYGNALIPYKEEELICFSQEEADCIGLTIGYYNKYSPASLTTISMKEDLWKKAYKKGYGTEIEFK